MNSRKSGKRGFTLTEITVVLAVLAIVSTMVVSFTAMVSNSRVLSSARLDALGDIRVAEALIERFIEGNEITTKFTDDDGNAITITTLTAENGNTLSFKKEGEQGGNLVINSATEGQNPETSVALERVTKITFDSHGNSDNTDKIYYCTISYKISNNEYNYTFCVNSYVGESIGGVTE